MHPARFARLASFAIVLATLPLGAQTAQPVQGPSIATTTGAAAAAIEQTAVVGPIRPPAVRPLVDPGLVTIPIDGPPVVMPPSDTVVVSVGAPRQITMSIVLGEIAQLSSFVPVFGPPAPVNLEPGSTLKLSTPASSIASITWYKGSSALAATTPTLEIATVTAADSGLYYATVKDASGASTTYEPVTIRVETPRRNRLLNLSTRGTINPSNPVLIGGFVIEGSPGQLAETKTVLLRAVGPTLFKFGVAQTLFDPKIQLFRSDGSAVDLSSAATAPGSASVTLAEGASGAFPLPFGTTDAVILISLPAGVYSAHVSSTSGGSGDVLLEVYEVPDTYLLPAM